ncbi:MAG: hypothetical protein H0T89_14345 [Deltaproteobacteria bacterium]|nr:hypothetical protein [Deltaproteobacteria bacterium]MDQ3296074.1 DUF6056 family protein [Myxococcota bacterium]
MSRAIWWWVALVLPAWLVLALCASWEPVTRDGWGNTYWYLLNELDPARLAQYVKDGWLGSNPRLGQTWTLLMYAPGPFHVITTPLLELAMFGLLTALALGRWPSVRRADDARAALLVTAVVAICTPQIGPMLFYRPFTGNYVFGLVLNLAWLVPYRFHAEAARSARAGSIWWAPALFLLGVAAGMCNEHTGPAFLGLGGLALVHTWRAGARGVVKAWMIAGLVGLAVGYVLLIVAPGHAHRYAGLANQAGIVERITSRGIGANLAVIGAFALYLAHAVPWIGLGIVGRITAPITPPAQSITPSGTPPVATSTWPANRRALVGLGLAGLVCTVTLLASPKLGPRLYLASVALAGVAIAGWVHAQLVTRWSQVACSVLSAAVLAYGGWRSVTVYRAIGPVGEARLRIIQDTPDGQAVVVPRYPVGASRWFLGDDLAVETLRKALARDYGLTAIELAPPAK